MVDKTIYLLENIVIYVILAGIIYSLYYFYKKVSGKSKDSYQKVYKSQLSTCPGNLLIRNAQIEYGAYDDQTNTNYCYVKDLSKMPFSGNAYIASSENIYPGCHPVVLGQAVNPSDSSPFNIKGDCPFSYTDKVNIYQ
jgi:hypothetical protein